LAQITTRFGYIDPHHQPIFGSLTLPEEEGAVQDGEEDSSISDKGEGNEGDEDDQENMY
jgi:hypothetical protein